MECGHAFVTHEALFRSVCRLQKNSESPTHFKGMQEQCSY
ncbi:hypothetical protein ACUYGN_07175 [Enterobacter chengduensis]|nr:hypothetical protein [Enterobacter chengduensis]MCM7423395.1 hypothetical protein [Enterobacter chengduensis]